MIASCSSHRFTGSPASKVPSTPVMPAGSRLACRETTASTAPESRRRRPRATAACLSHSSLVAGRRPRGAAGGPDGGPGRGGVLEPRQPRGGTPAAGGEVGADRVTGQGGGRAGRGGDDGGDAGRGG